MATYTVAASATGTALNTLVASTVDTVTFSAEATDMVSVEVVSPAANTADIWYTLDGSTPTVGGASTYYLPPGAVDARGRVPWRGITQAKLISSGTPSYRVQRGD